MSKQIPISISSEIFEIAPGYRRIVLVGKGIHNVASPDALIARLREQEELTHQNVTLEDSRLEAWRETFHAANIKTNKFRPSIDALTRRVLNGNELPSISTLVDIGTVLSLRHVLPCGAHSLNDVQQGLELRKAQGFEQFKPFGTDKSGTVEAGEIIFVDGNTVATNKWAWRQAVHTIIKNETTDFELNIDALSVITDEQLSVIIDDAKTQIKEFLNVDVEVLRLDMTTPSAEITLG